jgi:hypothetical protein
LVFEGQENWSGALNLSKTKKKEWICIQTPILQKPKKNELEPNPPPPTLFLFLKERMDLYTTPCPLPKNKIKMKTGEKNSFCTNLINLWKNLFCPLLFF